MPWGIAINETTKQCGGYWRGDEFTQYNLPEGWKDYYPETYYELDFDSRLCVIKNDESLATCCEQLGTKPEDIKIPEKPIVLDRTEDVEICHYPTGSHMIFSGDNRAVCESITKEPIHHLEYCEYEEGSLVLSDDYKLCYVVYNPRVEIRYERKGGEGRWQGRIPSPGECPNVPDENQYAGIERKIYPQSQLLSNDPPFSREYHFIALKDRPIVGDGKFCEFERGNEEKCCSQLGYDFVTQRIGKNRITGLGVIQFISTPNGLGSLIIVVIILLFIFLKKRK